MEMRNLFKWHTAYIIGEMIPGIKISHYPELGVRNRMNKTKK
jgi:hypothetical protein